MRNVLRHCIKVPVRLYVYAVSPLIPPSCRFQPTCSAYMLEALDRHGPGLGLLLGLRRLARCHPWHKACGHDPVPETFDWRGVIGYKRASTLNSALKTEK